MRFGFIQTEKATYPVRSAVPDAPGFCLGFLRLVPSGPSRRARGDAALKVAIRAAHAASGRGTGALASRPISRRRASTSGASGWLA